MWGTTVRVVSSNRPSPDCVSGFESVRESGDDEVRFRANRKPGSCNRCVHVKDAHM